MQEHSSTHQARSASEVGPGAGGKIYEQATHAMSNVADRASELWDDAYDQGERYYRQGSRVVSNMGGGTVALMLLVGTIGYALAWMIHGDQSYTGRNWTGSQASNRHRYYGDRTGSRRGSA